MKNIFEQGEFKSYSAVDLSKSRLPIAISHGSYDQSKIAVFISHKHSELEELKSIIGFLESHYNVNCYIDSRDPLLPKTTSGETAKRIKDRITACNKLILLATESAIESKWCNWELGFGDASKNTKNVAIFPIKEKGTLDSFYAGKEYLEIYPHIVARHGGDKYSNGTLIPPGYYIRKHNGDSYTITPLETWLKE